MADKKTTSFANQHGQDWETKEISVYGAAKAFIGQLGVGMDLTHVSIPAIFLLPYSILEFISIRMSKMFHYLLPLSKEPDPRKRLEGVMIFLLGSGQEEDLLLNHKPTNPIIGETHKARIDHEDGSHSYVLCEQTVHHPPTSAFDIYNPTHGVRLAGNMLFGVLFHHNSVTVETKGGLKVYLTLPDGSTEVYLMEAGVPDIYIKNVLLGTKYVYWTGNLHINCPSSGWNAQMAFGYKDSKNTINGVIWNAFQKGEKVEKKKEEKQSQGWASRWAKGAVTAAKSTAKFTTGWLYDQEGEDGWMANTKLFFDPEDVLARFSGSSGVECWVYPGGLQRKAEGTPKQTKKEKTETPPQERYLLFNGKDLVPKECDVYPDPENLEENSSLTIWKAVGEAIVRGDVEAADVEKTKVEEKQRAERKTREEKGDEFVPRYFVRDDSDGWPFWTLVNLDWYKNDVSKLYCEN